jgi:ArsR family transcriptional regulator
MLLLRLKALADETRIGIVKSLFSGRKKVTDIANGIGKSQPAVSIALKQLLQAGIVSAEREGKFTYYSVQDKDNIKKVMELLQK